MSLLLIENQYFGSVNYYKILFNFTHVEIEQYEYYQKMSFRNRCIVPGANGLIHLSVPLQDGRNQRQVMKDVRVAYRDNWVLQHCRTLEACYNRAPFFEYYREELFSLLEKRPAFLMDLDMLLLHWVLQKIKADLRIECSEKYRDVPEAGTTDARNRVLPKNYTDGVDPVRYTQVFEDRIGFMPNMSILDLLFCAGPGGINLLKSNTHGI
ncbi:MAG: WbqC family protein [Sediminibacterium sp.]|nr:WbqC family protein [Sediminibacterium sp.]